MMNWSISINLLLLGFISSLLAFEIIQVRLSPDSSNSWIVQHGDDGFIIDCGAYWEHGQVLGQTWRKTFPRGELPTFIFLTHTHPENFLGLVSLLTELNVTRLPVYVGHPGALTEMNYWLEIWKEINPFETSTLFDPRQSPDRFPYRDHIRLYDQPYLHEQIEIISNFPRAESVYPSMIYLPKVNALFTGDLVAVNSHLLVSPVDSYTDSDLHICSWIGILQSLTCSFPPSTRIYPGHGEGPSPMSFRETVESNIRWLIYMRGLVFNSCNTTFVMRILDDVFRNYSNIDQSRASLANRIPQSAISVGCKCSATNLSNTCGGLQPPFCQFLPKNRTGSTKSTSIPIACLHQYLSSSTIRLIRPDWIRFIPLALLLSILIKRQYSI